MAGRGKHEKVVHFFRRTAPLTQTISWLFEVSDPACYQRYRATYTHMARNSGLVALQASDRACFLGVVLLINLCAEPHKDVSDTRNGWVAIVCFGDFQRGDHVVPERRFWPGDVIFLRSAVFTHFVLPFEGERASMVYFTHENMSRDPEEGMASPSRIVTFLEIQRSTPKLKTILDVATCWNSTYFMLVRALRLRDAMADWIHLNNREENIASLALNRTE
ncbi:MAG: hypothetical protein M1826_001690 [Phylliscum demangeonii]|nr:MAG: hypothetical protein M1826_001690 [Phylliscum demangeonii]